MNMTEGKRETPTRQTFVCGINMGPVTQSYPYIHVSNLIHHSCVIHPSISPSLTNPQCTSSLLLDIVDCVHFLLSWMCEVGIE